MFSQTEWFPTLNADILPVGIVSHRKSEDRPLYAWTITFFHQSNIFITLLFP